MGAGSEPLSVYGDSGYGSGSVLDTLERAGANILCKIKAPVAPAGRFTKDDFRIDMKLGAVVCAAGRTAWLREVKGGQVARFGRACQACPLFERCTTASTGGRSVSARTSNNSPADASAKQIRRGRPTTKPPARRSSGTRPFDATPPRRQTCPCPRAREGERGLQAPRRRDQSRPPRHARCHHPQPLCCHERLKRQHGPQNQFKRHPPSRTATTHGATPRHGPMTSTRLPALNPDPPTEKSDALGQRLARL